MVDAHEFCQRLVDDFMSYFRKIQVRRLITQSKSSCRYIIESCLDYQPQHVLDIGTNYGLSTLSLAYSMKTLGQDLGSLTTFDCDHTHWKNETPDIQRGVLLNSEIDIETIPYVTEDFINLDPEKYVSKGKTFVFYDIHDTLSVSYMEKFLKEWVPLFSEARVMVHDFYLEHSGCWVEYDNPDYPMVSVEHFSGMKFEGYKEADPLMEWPNSRDKKILASSGTSTIEFEV